MWGTAPRSVPKSIFQERHHSHHCHMHRSGRKIPLQVIRDGKELPEIARLDPLSDAGASVHVDCKLLPGDTVKLRCAFDNPMNQVLRWGDDRYDEMCLVNFRCYPVTDLVFCADFVRGQTEMWALLSVCRRCAARIVSQDRQVAQAEASTESTLTTRAASRVPVLCLLAEGQGALRQASWGSYQCFRGSNFAPGLSPGQNSPCRSRTEGQWMLLSNGDMHVGTTSAGPRQWTSGHHLWQ